MAGMERKRIVHIIGGGEIGGAERLVLTLMQLLDKTRYEVQLICLCPGPFAELAAEKGFKVTTLAMKHRLDITMIKPIRQYLAENHIDLVHTHGVRANLVGRPAAKKEGLPVVTTVHSVLDYDYDHVLKAYVARLVTRLGNKYTDQFIAISKAIAQELVDLKVPENKINIIYNGLDTSKLISTRPPEELSSSWGLNPNCPVISMIARLHPVKGHEYFLRAARLVIDSGIEARFLIIGEGISRHDIEIQVKQLGLEDYVVMPGYYSQVADIYAISSILCVPSLMEGLGLVVLEAMYCGVPVIASRVGGIPEIISNGVDGILIEPGDFKALAEAITSLYKDANQREFLVQNGLNKVKHFTIEYMGEQVDDLYQSLLA